MDTIADRRDELEQRFSSLVEEAHKKYLASADENQKDFLSTPITSTNGLLRLIRDQNEQFSNFRNRERRLLDVVGNLIKPVEIIGGIASGAAEEAFPPAQSIFTAVMFLVNAANDVSEIYDAIIDLFTRLQVSFPRSDSGIIPALNRPGLLTVFAGLHHPLRVLHQGGDVTTAAGAGRANPRRSFRDVVSGH